MEALPAAPPPGQSGVPGLPPFDPETGEILPIPIASNPAMTIPDPK